MNASPALAARNPWPIAIGAFFAVAITAIISFIVFASRHKMELVRPDYYEEELGFQKQMERVSRTRAFAGDASITRDDRSQTILIRLPVIPGQAAGTGQVHLYRPSDARLDRRMPLATDPVGRQVVDTRGLANGLWKLRVTWKAGPEEYFLEHPVLLGGGNP
jgi:nitrogen fixation protein FixH